MTTTDTPRTDACPHCGATDDCMCFSEELKQALAASNAKVERLNKQLNHIVENPHEYDVKIVFEPPFVEELQSEIKMLTKKLSITREWLDERYKATSDADERAEKAEAELEKIKAGKVFVDPKWIYDLETQLAKAHEELCQAGLREYGN